MQERSIIEFYFVFYFTENCVKEEQYFTIGGIYKGKEQYIGEYEFIGSDGDASRAEIVFSYYLNWLNERIGKNWRVNVINLTIFDLASGEVDDLVNERRINYGVVKYIFCINCRNNWNSWTSVRVIRPKMSGIYLTSRSMVSEIKKLLRKWTWKMNESCVRPVCLVWINFPQKWTMENHSKLKNLK